MTQPQPQTWKWQNNILKIHCTDIFRTIHWDFPKGNPSLFLREIHHFPQKNPPPSPGKSATSLREIHHIPPGKSTIFPQKIQLLPWVFFTMHTPEQWKPFGKTISDAHLHHSLGHTHRSIEISKDWLFQPPSGPWSDLEYSSGGSIVIMMSRKNLL